MFARKECMMKKFLAAFLAVALLFGFAACGKSDSGKDLTITKSGEYDLTREYENIYIAAAGVTLKNAVVKNELRIEETVGDGEVYLDDVTVQGKLNVLGGGKNSAYLRGKSTVDQLVVNRTGKTVHVVIEPDCLVSSATLNSTTLLDVQGSLLTLTASSTSTGSNLHFFPGSTTHSLFIESVLSANIQTPLQALQVSGNLSANPSITASEAILSAVLSTPVDMNLSGTIGTLSLSENAKNSAITLQDSAKVETLMTNTLVNLLGGGTINQVFTNDTGNILGVNLPGNIRIVSNIDTLIKQAGTQLTSPSSKKQVPEFIFTDTAPTDAPPAKAPAKPAIPANPAPPVNPETPTAPTQPTKPDPIPLGITGADFLIVNNTTITVVCSIENLDFAVNTKEVTSSYNQGVHTLTCEALNTDDTPSITVSGDGYESFTYTYEKSASQTIEEILIPATTNKSLTLPTKLNGYAVSFTSSNKYGITSTGQVSYSTFWYTKPTALTADVAGATKNFTLQLMMPTISSYKVEEVGLQLVDSSKPLKNKFNWATIYARVAGIDTDGVSHYFSFTNNGSDVVDITVSMFDDGLMHFFTYANSSSIIDQSPKNCYYQNIAMSFIAPGIYNPKISVRVLNKTFVYQLPQIDLSTDNSNGETFVLYSSNQALD